MIKKWFFIRYDSSGFHLRLRILLENLQSFHLVFDQITRVLNAEQSNGKIIKYNLDSYIRELERYGHLSIECSETLFCISSEICQAILRLEVSKSNKRLRLLSGFFIFDFTMKCFGLKVNEMLEICRKQSNSGPFNYKSHIETSAEKLSHEELKMIQSVINSGELKSSEFSDVLLILASYKSEYIISCKAIRENIEQDYFDFHYLIASHNHMHANRLFETQSNYYEWMIYDYLARIYSSSKTLLVKENNSSDFTQIS
jgi:thiopeptide-type bacteriocin biosynthesis protein